MTLELLNDNITTGAVTRQATLRPEEVCRKAALWGLESLIHEEIQGIADIRHPRTHTFVPPIPVGESPWFGNAGDSIPRIQQVASLDDRRPDFRDAPAVADEWAKTPELCRRELSA